MILSKHSTSEMSLFASVVFLASSLQKKIDSLDNKAVRLLNRDLSGQVDSLIMIGVALATTGLFVGAMSLLIKFMASEFTNITTAVPNFDFHVIDGVEVGNASFLIFSILRDVAFPMFLLVFFLFGALLVIKQAQLASNEVMKKMLQSAFIGIIVLLIFPYIWDPISDTSEKSGLSMMNPLYSHDEKNPCVEISGVRNRIFFEHMESIAKHSQALGISPDTNSICRPDLLPNYLFAKALYGADMKLDFEKADGSDVKWWDIPGQIQSQMTVFADSLFSVMFVGMTKITMLLFLTTMAVMIGDIRYILLDVIAIGLPILLVLRCIPFMGIDKLANKLTELFVPLLFVPIFAGLIMLAGTANLVQYEDKVTTVILPAPTSSSSGEAWKTFNDGLGTNTPTLRSDFDAENIDDSEYLDTTTITDIHVDRFLFSLRAMAVLILVIMSPVMFVPMLGSVASMAGKMAMTGVMTGVLGTAQMMQGGASGGAAAFSGMRAGGGHSTLGGIKRALTNPGAMGSIMGGITGGLRGSTGQAFANDFGGAGRIMPGAGSFGRMFSKGGDSAGSDSFHDAFEKESHDTVEDLTEQENAAAVIAGLGGSSSGGVGNSGQSHSPLEHFTGPNADNSESQIKYGERP